MRCPTDQALSHYASGELTPREAATVNVHLGECTRCLGRLDELGGQADSLIAALRSPIGSASDPMHPKLADAVAAVLASATVSTTSRESAVLPSGALLGGYRIIESIGQGGMGRVYRAAHPRLDQEVALKVLRFGLDSRQFLARFETERQALALMDHPNIARVTDGGVSPDGQPFFAMELVRGIPIDQYCDRQQLDIRARLKAFLSVCEAVQHAHLKGIIHRDLKPSNVLVAEYDAARPTPKVIDFGVARAVERQSGKQTEAGWLMGTPLYMSPEQARLSSHDIDTRSDIYSLGAMLYELLVGEAPFEHRVCFDTPIIETLRIVREEEPQPPSKRLVELAQSGQKIGGPSGTRTRNTFTRKLPQELDWIVLKALERDRARRYETAASLAEDIRRFLRDEPLWAGPPSRTYRLKKFIRRNRAAVVFGSVTAVLLVVSSAVSATMAWWANYERLKAQAAEHDALEAADKESQARAVAENRLVQIQRTNEILNSVFRDIDPRQTGTNDETLRQSLGQRLDNAAQQLNAEANVDPVAAAKLLDTLGTTQLNLGFLDKAIELLTQASQSSEKNLGPDDGETLRIRGNLAAAFVKAKRTKEAIEVLEDVVRKRQQSGELTSFAQESNLATAYLHAGRVHQSFEIHRQIYERRVAELGPTHRDTINSCNNLSGAYRAIGQLDKAIELRQENLKHCRDAFGHEHVVTLGTRANLAAMKVEAGRVSEAIPELESVLAARSAAFAADHPDVLSSRSNLAEAYRAARRPADAIAIHRQVHEIRLDKLGSENAETLSSLHFIAQSLHSAGKFDEAISVYEEALRDRTRVLGDDHFETLSNASNLAVAYAQAGRTDDAIRLQEQTYSIRLKKFGPDHPDSQQSAANLSSAYIRGKRWDDMERVTEELIESFRRAPPRKFRLRTKPLSELGQRRMSTGNADSAETLFRECLTLLTKHAPDSFSTFDMQARLGESLLVQKKFAEAEPLQVGGYEGMKKTQKEGSATEGEQLARALKRIVVLYETWGKPDEAERWRSK